MSFVYHLAYLAIKLKYDPEVGNDALSQKRKPPVGEGVCEWESAQVRDTHFKSAGPSTGEEDYEKRKGFGFCEMLRQIPILLSVLSMDESSFLHFKFTSLQPNSKGTHLRL
ncbi:hypothetical protein AVEN_130085-1 [Araneus ventricosus]|uniref:Uncharacterized protein n=1 Tax=Araneus ventricosus TaxID=182803 RepID=A0A4Y2EM35_ARAVE|nr:hypothetical protein AVEN_130085-1 [Araneus ventricosus]